MSVGWIQMILSREIRSTEIVQKNDAKSLESRNLLILITLKYVSKTLKYELFHWQNFPFQAVLLMSPCMVNNLPFKWSVNSIWQES